MRSDFFFGGVVGVDGSVPSLVSTFCLFCEVFDIVIYYTTQFLAYNEIMNKVPYKAPDFSLKDSDGKVHSLEEYRGSWVVLYFYPKDDTPGCTTEACSLRDARDTLADMGVHIIGVSRDEPSSHEKFKQKYSLTFTLLTDADAIVINRYGAWGKKMFGKEGVLRKTFIINPLGDVVKVYGRVTPMGHGEQVIADVKALQAAA